MSKLAGTLMILVGLATILLGVKEVNKPEHLTPYAAWSSVGLGAIIALAGAAHFRAPHKAFLLSIPILITFILHIYCVGLFFNVQKLQLFLLGHIAAVVLILGLSYAGYRRRKVTAAL
jgi:purine-cytosine permease-like protein